MPFEVLLVTLFSVATAVAIAARWLKVPYTVALVVAGLVLGTVQAITPPHLTKELLYSVFLPGLIFEAAFHLDRRGAGRRNGRHHPDRHRGLLRPGHWQKSPSKNKK